MVAGGLWLMCWRTLCLGVLMGLVTCHARRKAGVEVQITPDGHIEMVTEPDKYPLDILKITHKNHADRTADTLPRPQEFNVPLPRDNPAQPNMPKPSGLMSTSGNPLRDQPNMSRTKKDYRNIIQGSRKAFTITKMEYLRKEWCKTEKLRQIIREDGCRKRTIMNKFCYGQCNSFFIPKTDRKGGDTEVAAFKSCSFCKPRRTSWVTVTLNCPGRKGKPPKMRRKRIQMIKSCQCMAQKFP